MKGFVVCHKGIEEIAALELKEIIGVKGLVSDRLVSFEEVKPEDVAKLCYCMQSITKAGELLKQFSAKKDFFDRILAEWESLDFPKLIPKEVKVSITCKRIGNHLFSSQDVVTECAKVLHSSKYAVDYKNPDIIFYIFIVDNHCLIGIDYAGIDLSKREYRIFVNQRSLKAPLAYALMRMPGLDEKKVIIDPFTRSGETIIEAALFLTHKSPWHYKKEGFAFCRFPQFKECDALFESWDSKFKEKKLQVKGYDSLMRNVTAANKNAKIAAHASIFMLCSYFRTFIKVVYLIHLNGAI